MKDIGRKVENATYTAYTLSLMLGTTGGTNMYTQNTLIGTAPTVDSTRIMIIGVNAGSDNFSMKWVSGYIDIDLSTNMPFVESTLWNIGNSFILSKPFYNQL
ncbi:hypothetical protein PGC35_06305 [Psychrobacillus sp. PGGUH221]|uniref:hypothetical protein n=1 Tax=Psychrobacillus sp. PGGUH221 TaxID=3020058 RepID=UPI0035C6E205